MDIKVSSVIYRVVMTIAFVLVLPFKIIFDLIIGNFMIICDIYFDSKKYFKTIIKAEDFKKLYGRDK